MRLWNDTEDGNLRLTNDNGLSPVHLRAIRLLLEAEKPLKDIAAELGITADTFREMRRKRGFAEEYRRQLARLEVESFDYPIVRRVARIAALNSQWVKIRDQLDASPKPRVDLIYAMVALQKAAAAELGQDVQRVEVNSRFEITEQIQVIRFEALPPRDESDGEVVDAEFTEFNALPEPDSEEEFSAALTRAGLRLDSGKAQAEELTAIRRAIEERGMDPRDVLSDDQFRQVYGREKGDDPWAI